jgi:hypothetical protein
LETTDWSAYGRKSGNPKCSDCMVHCGYEPTAVSQTFGSLRGFMAVARLSLFGPPRQKGALSDDPVTVAPAISAPKPAGALHQLNLPSRSTPQQPVRPERAEAPAA